MSAGGSHAGTAGREGEASRHGENRQAGQVTLRSHGQIVKGGFLIALGLAPLILVVVGVPMPVSALTAGFLGAGVTGAACSFFFLPELRYSAAGLTIINPLRTIQLPWPALTEITTRFYLTAHGRSGQHWDAAAFPAGGALAAGRRLLPARHPAAARHADLPMLPGRGAASHTRWVNLARAAEQLRTAHARALDAAGLEAAGHPDSTNRPVRSVDRARAVLCLAWVACLAAGCGLAFT